MSTTTNPTNQSYPRGIIIVSVLMILFGLAEVITGFNHYFFGIITSEDNLSTVIGVVLGTCYFIGGLLILTKKKWAASLAIALLCVDVIGRISMVVTGLYPINSFMQIFAIVVGTSVAAFFAVYVSLRLKFFV